MFYIPMGIFLGAPNITVGYYIWKSMIPAALGNIIGGGLFCATVYWYLFLTGTSTPITIDGENFNIDSRPLTHENDLEAGTRSTDSSSPVGTMENVSMHHEHKGNHFH